MLVFDEMKYTATSKITFISTYKYDDWYVYKYMRFVFIAASGFQKIPKGTTTKIGTIPAGYTPDTYRRYQFVSIQGKKYQIMVDNSANRDLNCFNYESTALTDHDTLNSTIIYPSSRPV